MIVICELGHEWNTDERDGVELGQPCGALLYANYDHPEDTKRCTSILKERRENWPYYYKDGMLNDFGSG